MPENATLSNNAEEPMKSTIPIPNSLPEFHRLFPDETACEAYLAVLRWPEGFVCPSCGGTKAIHYADRAMWFCPACRTQTYLTAGTIFHKSHTPLLTWFYGVFLTTILTPGISAVQFQKALGMTRYETAFQMLHKIRHAMVNPDRDALHGVVQVDETYLGGVRVGEGGGRTVGHKTVVAGAVEVRLTKEKKGDRKPPHLYAGRVRFRVVPDASAKSLLPFVQEHIGPGSTVVTDGWKPYQGLSALGYEHAPHLTNAPVDEREFRDLIHLEFSNLKTWLAGTHHGRVEKQHVQAYLNEFAFRHNRRFYDPGFGFLRVLTFGMQGRAPTYDELYEADEYGRDVHLSDVEAEVCGCESLQE